MLFTLVRISQTLPTRCGRESTLKQRRELKLAKDTIFKDNLENSRDHTERKTISIE